MFLIFVAASKYGKIRMGRSDSKPEYNDISWFCMLFSCGIAVGVYTFACMETMTFYRHYRGAGRASLENDDDVAQAAILQLFYHWGFHAWAPYITVAITLGVTSYRWNLPLTMRSAFYPLLGNLVYSPLGDLIDAASIVTTTFGVCTSLGLGVENILKFAQRLDDEVKMNIGNKILIVVIMTLAANVSVMLGIKKGMQVLSTIAFSLGLFALILPLFLDNTWFLLSSYVQSVGHYLQWMVQIGFKTDSFEMLQYEFTGRPSWNADYDGNLLWGSSNGDHNGHLHNVMEGVGDVLGTANLDQATLYNSGVYQMQDWWTIFYWGWWVSWAPFVGMFIARISKGRTLRQVIVGAFVAPTLFGFFWLGTWGSLTIKMQRVAELTLGAGVSDVATMLNDPTYVSSDALCQSMGYSGKAGYPVSAAAVALANEGYYLLSCRTRGMELLDIFEPYNEVKKFVYVILLVGLVLYFVTSSDSGSYVDDIVSAGGMLDPPIIQKIFWCWTEGAVAIALLKAGDVGGTADSGLKALQAVSIVCGLPFTVAILFMCTSTWRALKIDSGDADICQATQWSTGTLDMFDGFSPSPATVAVEPRYSPVERIKHYVVATLSPFFGVFKTAESLFGEKSPLAIGHGVCNFCLFLAWFIFLCMSGSSSQWSNLAWTFFAFFAFQLTFIRASLRQHHNIYGNIWEDFAASLFMYPNVVSQLHYQSTEKTQNNDVYKKTAEAAAAQL